MLNNNNQLFIHHLIRNLPEKNENKKIISLFMLALHNVTKRIQPAKR